VPTAREHLFRWFPVVVWAALISTFSTGVFTFERTGAILLPLLHALFPTATYEELRAIHAAIRKTAHFAEYLVLSTLLYRALRAGRRWDVRAAVMAIVIAGLYSVGDELHQWFVPGRTAAATDCLIDVSGAAAGQGLLAAWGNRGRATRPARAS
jgi:VanZ family protein